MRPLILSSTLWIIVVMLGLAFLRVFPVDGRTGQRPASTRYRRYILVAVGWIAMAGGLLNIALRLAAGYINPRDFVQDYVAASQFVYGATMYPDDLPELGARATAEEFPGRAMFLESPVFKNEFKRLGETAPANAHPPVIGMILVGPVAIGGLRGSYLFTAAALLLVLLASFRAIIGALGRHPGRFGWMLIVGLLLGWHPVNAAIRSAQPGILILGCVTAGWIALRRQHSISAGIWFGLAASIQAFPLLLVAYTILRDRRAFFSALLSMAGVVALVTLMAPPGSYQDWSATMSRIAPQFVAAPENVSFVGLMMRVGTLFHTVFPMPIVTLITMACVLGPIAMLFTVGCRQRKSLVVQDLEIAIVVVLMVALSPLSWSRYLPILLLPLAILATLTSPLKLRGELIWLLVATLLLSIPDGTIVAGHAWLTAEGVGIVAFLFSVCIPLGMALIVTRLVMVHRRYCSGEVVYDGDS